MTDAPTASNHEAALRVLEEGRTLALEIIERLAALELPPDGTAAEELRLFAAVDGLAKRLDKTAKKAKDVRDGLNERALAALEEIGLKNAPLDGGPTVYRERQLWAGVPEPEQEGATRDYDAACDALEEAGLGEYVQRRFNVQSLSSYFRELERQEDERRRELELPPVMDPEEEILPAELRGKVTLAEVVKAKARGS